ncbi:AMP-binding protein [Rhodococcus sp. T2V]|uniref:(2,3-dihydroxybenzoyl)adenylate synthase n=1 Tax=Rhodococcus sp. T2V TaxID=3034164 RepID=UPI0023E2B2B7|nr:AMP-binding protein [Rhodococcus sp. T2V]MDF3304462.1 AMP-binding protein [Rhodococcus sp. T2V]
MTTELAVQPNFIAFEDDRAQRYVDAGLWRGRSIPAAFDEWVDAHGHRRAVIDDGSEITYTELESRVRTTAAGFAERGIAPGDRVVVQLPNTTAFVVVLFALLECGAVPVLTLPAHRAREIVHLAALSEATAYVTTDVDGGFDHRELARDVVAAVPTVTTVIIDGDAAEFTPLADVRATERTFDRADSRDVAVLLVSGGTTGLPKLIPRTHNDYEYNARASAEVCALTADDVYLAVLPAAHNFPLACPGILGTLGAGAAVVMTRDPSPEHAFGLIEKHGITVTALVPSLTHLWCEATEWETANLSTLRLLQVGGAKLTPEVAKLVQPTLGCTLQQVFGMAEGLLNYTRLTDPDELRITTQGRPLSEFDEVRIVDEHGHDVAAGTVGELLTRGPYTINGYYSAAEHNRTAITADGFYRSGDQVRMLETGHLIVTGRIKDVITRGGENVAADTLEDLLLTHPAVSRVAVIGIPDRDLGESVCAVIVARGAPPTLADLRSFLLDSGCARNTLPDRTVSRPSLPMTAVGKIDKNALIADVGSRS